MSDEFDGVGGSYEIRDGKRVQVEAPTKDHPEGNRPRDSEGRPLDVAPEPAPAAPPEKPRGGPRRPASMDT